MTVRIANAQRRLPVDTGAMARLARAVVRRLRIRRRGLVAVTFIDDRRMRALNRRFLGQDRPTDVLSFRYDQVAGGSGLGARGNCPQPTAHSPQPIVGEILIAPGAARAYAKRHRIPYEQELSRYVVHGLLHWMGYEDHTVVERRKMRTMEDRLLGIAGSEEKS